jgi:hypothetical protein
MDTRTREKKPANEGKTLTLASRLIEAAEVFGQLVIKIAVVSANFFITRHPRLPLSAFTSVQV